MHTEEKCQGIVITYDPFAATSLGKGVPCYEPMPFRPLRMERHLFWSDPIPVTVAIGLPMRCLDCRRFSTLPPSLFLNETIKKWTGEEKYDDFLFQRADGEDLGMEQMQAVDEYIMGTSKAELTPQGFKDFFEAMKAKKKGWEGVECPI